MLNFPFLLNLFLLFSPIFTQDYNNTWNLKADLTINLKKPVAHIKNIIKIYHNGSNPLKTYFYPIPDSETFSINCSNELGKELITKLSALFNNDFRAVEVFLIKPLERNQSATLICNVFLWKSIIPLQKTREIHEDQIALYSRNLPFFSPYFTKQCRVKFELEPKSILEISPSPLNINQPEYTFSDVAPYSKSRFEVIYINNNAFLTVTNLERDIDVCHFGVITITDRVFVKNWGPRISGPFNREANRKATTHWLYTHLPASAYNIKFFDELGNSSKTSLIYSNNYLTLKFQPRYPLYGGWKTNYVLRYDVPAFEYLLTDTINFYKLSIRAVDHVLSDTNIDLAKVQIVLPEGAHIKNLILSSKFKLLRDHLNCYKSLCVFGRPTISLEAQDLMEFDVDTVTVEYHFSSLYLLRVPILIIIYLQMVILIYFIWKFLNMKSEK